MSILLFTNNTGTGGSSPSSPLTIDPQPTDVWGLRQGTGTIRSNVTSFSVSGGIPPYKYEWQWESGNTLSVQNPFSNSTRFYWFAEIVPELSVSTYKCKVTDSAAIPNTIFTNPIYIELAADSFQ